MAEKKEIHQFAKKYLRLFTEPEPPAEELLRVFGEQCRALGFHTDLGESFMRLYSGDAFYEAGEFERIASAIEDPYVLGTAIFSRWRLVTQWEKNNLLAEDKRAWFRAALERLEELTSEEIPEAPLLQGDIDSLLLVSNDLAGVAGSSMATGMEQRVTISATGDVTFASRRYNASPSGHNVISRDPAVHLNRDAVVQIMTATRTAFPYLPAGASTAAGMSAEPGTWTLIATNRYGQTFRTSGEMGTRIVIDGTDLSDLIREKTGHDDLLLFDGNPDLVMRLEVQYHRGEPAKGGDKAVHWTYAEQLVFDRRTGTMEHYLDAGPSHRVRTSSQLGGAIGDFLDLLDPETGFSEPVGNPPDAVPPADEVVSYKATILTKYGTTRVISGTYDALSLPAEWASFIDRALTLMGFFGYGEMFDEGRYGRALRRTSDTVYALTAVDGVEEPQWYISEDPAIKDRDIVIVPYGPSNEERPAVVLQVVYASLENAPGGSDALKKILRFATPGSSSAPSAGAEQKGTPTTQS